MRLRGALFLLMVTTIVIVAFVLDVGENGALAKGRGGGGGRSSSSGSRSSWRGGYRSSSSGGYSSSGGSRPSWFMVWGIELILDWLKVIEW